MPDLARDSYPDAALRQERDAMIKLFADAGLVPRIGTNGGMIDADIEVTADKPKGPKLPMTLTRVVLTERGHARLNP